MLHNYKEKQTEQTIVDEAELLKWGSKIQNQPKKYCQLDEEAYV